MKKLNKKGFTLIELLAVIVIMGILMMVAIPAMTRYINNSKKDVYIDTVKQYVDAVKTNYAANDYLSCSGQDGLYYINFSEAKELLQSGGTSPYGGKDISGYILMDLKSSGKSTYTVYASDGKNGIRNVEYTSLARSNVTDSAGSMSNPTTTAFSATAGTSSGSYAHCTVTK